jgi:hypothetical protein
MCRARHARHVGVSAPPHHTTSRLGHPAPDATPPSLHPRQVFALSVGRGYGRATPGSALLNLRYRSEPSPLARLLASPLAAAGARTVRRRAMALPCAPRRAPRAATSLGAPTHAPSGPSPSHRPACAPPQAQHSTAEAAPPASPAAASCGASGVEGPGLSLPQRVALGLGSVALPYAWARATAAMAAADWDEEPPSSWRRRALCAARRLEGCAAAAAAAHDLVFLVAGDYRWGRGGPVGHFLRLGKHRA